MAMTPKSRKQRQHQRDIARLQDPKYDEETYREKMYDPKRSTIGKIGDFLPKDPSLIRSILSAIVGKKEEESPPERQSTSAKRRAAKKHRKRVMSRGQPGLYPEVYRDKGGLVGKNKVVTGYKKGGQV
tara:strand:- start:1262 stop:1645 length:384 start_codon:yes stop_codon:yes gene_type:complete